MSLPVPLPVEMGFGWTAAGSWGACLLLLGVIIRQIGPWRKQSIDANQKLRDDLLRRVEKLERELDRKEARHQAERALDRHKLANLSQAFDAVMLMLEAAPEKAIEIVGKIKEMRSRQMESEALEKAAIHAAAIVDSDERQAYRVAETKDGS